MFWARSFPKPSHSSIRPTKTSPLGGPSLDSLRRHENLARASQASRKVRLDVRIPDVAVELSLLHELCGLVSHPTEHQVPPRRVQDVRKVFQSMKARRINRGHIAETQNDDLR